MAKKDKKNIIALKCPKCENKNYTTFKSKLLKEKISNKKFCPKCNVHTQHEEAKIK